MEADRLAFVEHRDGVAGAVDFATRTLRAYREALKRRNGRIVSGYGQAYRRTLLTSIMEFRRYIRAHPLT